jgi:hypothetical protein
MGGRTWGLPTTVSIILFVVVALRSPLWRPPVAQPLVEDAEARLQAALPQAGSVPLRDDDAQRREEAVEGKLQFSRAVDLGIVREPVPDAPKEGPGALIHPPVGVDVEGAHLVALGDRVLPVRPLLLGVTLSEELSVGLVAVGLGVAGCDGHVEVEAGVVVVDHEVHAACAVLVERAFEVDVGASLLEDVLEEPSDAVVSVDRAAVLSAAGDVGHEVAVIGGDVAAAAVGRRWTDLGAFEVLLPRGSFGRPLLPTQPKEELGGKRGRL